MCSAKKTKTLLFTLKRGYTHRGMQAPMLDVLQSLQQEQILTAKIYELWQKLELA